MVNDKETLIRLVLFKVEVMYCIYCFKTLLLQSFSG